ncbi:5862_t:CDS:2 [Dentiscutata heterogama]|uniref:5862_t:CDS:1 n=1 Tax=Dentiscutata heterogama TaxID=1316150 RepID=A0ACA9MNF9_9GLOM|nr:5862_t:CDS:2 [Dentiscutata heterogama]
MLWRCCKGIYTTLEKSFEEQGIIVNGIKELTDDQLIELASISKDDQTYKLALLAYTLDVK